VEAVSGEHLVVRGRVGDDPLPGYPVEERHRRKVPHHLTFLGGQDPAVHLVRQRVGCQPAPDRSVPIDLVSLGVVGVDQRAQLIGAAFEIGVIQWAYRYLRCSGRDRLPILLALGARLLSLLRRVCPVRQGPRDRV
jgi:hypothetical protein